MYTNTYNLLPRQHQAALEDHRLYVPAYQLIVKVHNNNTALYRGDFIFQTPANGGGTCSTSETTGEAVDWFGCCSRTAYGDGLKGATVLEVRL